MGVRSVSFCALAFASACVDPLSGSDVQIDFSSGVQTPARPGSVPAPNQPLPNTFFTLYAVQNKVDPATNTVVQDYVFEVRRFEIVPLIDRSSPCFIEVKRTKWPGLHITKFLEKISEANGVPLVSGKLDLMQLPPLCDAAHQPAGCATQADIDAVVDASVRDSHLADLEGKVEAVTDTANAKYPASATTCIDDDANVDQSLFPPPTCTGDKANALRLKLCQAFWHDNPDFYEGNDKVFTLPLNGQFRGIVEGSNPVNGGFVGGSEFVVDTVLSDPDEYFVSWQFKDLDGDGNPDYPAGTKASDKHPLGHIYMSGKPYHAARGVTSVHLQNSDDPSIAGQMAIFPDISNRGTHF